MNGRHIIVDEVIFTKGFISKEVDFEICIAAQGITWERRSLLSKY